MKRLLLTPAPGGFTPEEKLYLQFHPRQEGIIYSTAGHCQVPQPPWLPPDFWQTGDQNCDLHLSLDPTFEADTQPELEFYLTRDCAFLYKGRVEQLSLVLPGFKVVNDDGRGPLPLLTQSIVITTPESIITVLRTLAEPVARVRQRDNHLLVGPVSGLPGGPEALLYLAESLLLQRQAQPLYDRFAAYYDEYMAHVDYQSWVNLLLDLTNRRLARRPERILDMACGTATVSCELVKRGLTVEAFDLSPWMLVQAAQKANTPALYWYDMLKPLPTGRYDLIICLFDSVNYLENLDLLPGFFANVRQALTPEGVFIFDVATRANSREFFADFINVEEKPGDYIVHIAEYDDKKREQESRLEFFSPNGIAYMRQTEVHRQHIWSPSQIEVAITAAGWQVSGIYSPDKAGNLQKMAGHLLEENFYRLFYLLVNR